jgi:folylpolyglutamate synthase
MEILGDTLSDIAFEKTGIFKPGGVAVTVPQQEDAIKKVIERSHALETDLFITRPVQDILGESSAALGSLTADFQRVNASLAISLASVWMSKFAPDKLKTTIPKPKNSSPTIPEMFPAVPNTPEIEHGILEFNWPGRAQIEKISDRETLFIDGAHTTESIRTCLEWYLKQTRT